LIKKIISNSESETFELGNELSKLLSPGDVVGFTGELGAGKTVLIKGILDGLGYDPRNVVSASFVIAQEYKAKFPVVHIDLYRFEDNEEIYYLDWDSYISSDKLVLVEWAEKIEGFLDFSLKVNIKVISQDKREVIFETEIIKLQKLLEDFREVVQ